MKRSTKIGKIDEGKGKYLAGQIARLIQKPVREAKKTRFRWSKIVKKKERELACIPYLLQFSIFKIL